MEVRTPSKIGPKVLAKHPVWEFLNDDEHPAGDTAMRPIENLPVDGFDGRLFGTTVTLADGSRFPAAISDLGFGPKKYRHHFRSLTIFAKGRRFHLAKYFQLWYDSEGPDALAAFEVDPESWTGRIVKSKPRKNDPCPRNDVSTVPSSKRKLALMP